MQEWGRRLPRTLRGGEKDREVVEPLRAEVAVLRHDPVPELHRIGNVALEEPDALPPSSDRGEVTGVEVLRAAAKIAVAGQTAARREDPGSGDGVGIVSEALGP